MAIDVVIPEVGEIGMEVTFVSWYRVEGEEVVEGEPLFQVDTQKTMFDVEAVGSGTLAGIRVATGEVVEPHQVIATLLAAGETYQPASTPAAVAAATEPGATAPESAAASAAPTQPLEAGAASAVGTRRPAASPRARALATSLGVSLESIAGTGSNGLITEADVRAADAQAAAPPTGPVSPDRASRTRRAVAEVTTRSWTEIPHFYVRLDADLSRGIERAKPLPLVVAALSAAFRDRPECHVGWGPDGTIVTRPSVDIGILVDTDEGLLLPVVRDVDRLGAAELAAAIVAAADRARRGRLSADDFGPRSATVSNLGMFSVDEFAGIVAMPDPLLLSIGRAGIRPRWDGAAWQPRTICTLTLSVDHRILDGADAGRLMTALEARLEGPDWFS